MSEETQRRLITILATGMSSVLASQLSEKFLDVPEERGVQDDVKEALLKATFTLASTVAASMIIRNVVSKRWGS